MSQPTETTEPTGKKPEDKGPDGNTGTEPTTEPTATESGESGGEGEGETDWKAEAEKWKALSRKHEKRESENAEKAKKWDEQQKAGMTEAQQATARAEAAEERADKAERELAKKDAMLAYGLEETDMRFLEHVPVDEFGEQAKALAARLKKAAPKTSNADGKPQEGKPVGGGGVKADLERIDAEIAQAISDRDTTKSIGLKRQRRELIAKQESQQ